MPRRRTRSVTRRRFRRRRPLRPWTENGSGRYEIANFGFTIFQSLDNGETSTIGFTNWAQLIQLNSSLMGMNNDITDALDEALGHASKGIECAGIIYDVQSSLFIGQPIDNDAPRMGHYEVTHALVVDTVDGAGVPRGIFWSPWAVADFPIYAGGFNFPPNETDKPLRQLHRRSSLLQYNRVNWEAGTSTLFGLLDATAGDPQYTHNRVSLKGRLFTDNMGLYLVLGNHLVNRDEEPVVASGSVTHSVSGQLYYRWLL